MTLPMACLESFCPFPPERNRETHGGPYLHRPEVKGQEEQHSDKAAHKASAEPVTAHIGDNGTHSEKQVEKGGQWVPRKEPRSPLTAKAKRAITELTVWVLTFHVFPRALQAPLCQATALSKSANHKS